MSSHSKSTSGQSSDANPSPPPPILIFELNQARRTKVTRELEALRSGTLSVCPKCSESDLTRIVLCLPHSSPTELPTAYLERPTLEGLEAFVEKKTEYNEMMADHIADLQAVTQEQLVIIEAWERAAKLAEERRLQEFQRTLERMDPAEAEVARRAERERPFHIQRRIAAQAAALEDEWIRERDRVRATFSYDN
ncbi:hypothetical protein F5888DRAFT_122496 [Russula emetica]|nr:hypothetical protein F5888DRAFT_122496 [Russula emetica]